MTMAAAGKVSRRTMLFALGVLLQALLAVAAWTLNNPALLLGGIVAMLFFAAIIVDYRAVFIAAAFVTFALDADIIGKLFVVPALGLNLYAMDFVLLFAACAWVTNISLGARYAETSTSLKLPIVLFLCSLPFFVGVGIMHGITIKNALADMRLFAYYCSFFLVLGLVRSRKDLHVLFWATIVCGIIGMVMAIGYSLSSTGYDADTGKAVFFERITGAHEGTYPMLFVASAAMLPFARSIEKRVTLLVCNVLSMVALFLSLTRGSWLAAAIGGAILVVLLYAHVPNSRKYFKAIALASIAVGIVVFVLFLFDLISLNLFFVRFTILSSKKLDTSTLIRFTEWKLAYDLFAAHPWTGIGLGYIYKFFAIGLGNVEHTFIHNSYLYVLSKMGIVGLTLFLSVFGTALTVWVRLLSRMKESEDLGLALAFGTMLVVIMFKSLTTWHLNDLALALYVGCLLGAIGVMQSWTRKDGAR